MWGAAPTALLMKSATSQIASVQCVELIYLLTGDFVAERNAFEKAACVDTISSKDVGK